MPTTRQSQPNRLRTGTVPSTASIASSCLKQAGLRSRGLSPVWRKAPPRPFYNRTNEQQSAGASTSGSQGHSLLFPRPLYTCSRPLSTQLPLLVYPVHSAPPLGPLAAVCLAYSSLHAVPPSFVVLHSRRWRLLRTSHVLLHPECLRSAASTASPHRHARPFQARPAASPTRRASSAA